MLKVSDPYLNQWLQTAKGSNDLPSLLKAFDDLYSYIIKQFPTAFDHISEETEAFFTLREFKKIFNADFHAIEDLHGALKEFLARRWKNIRHSYLAYDINLTSLINQMCFCIAARINPKEIYQLLMETLEVTEHQYPQKEPINLNALCLGAFVLTQDLTDFIELLNFYVKAYKKVHLDGDPDFYRNIPDSMGKLRAFTKNEFDRVCQLLPHAKEFDEAAKLIIQLKQTTALGVFEELCLDLKKGDMHNDGIEDKAGGAAYNAIAIFLNKYACFSDTDKKRIETALYRSPSYNNKYNFKDILAMLGKGDCVNTIYTDHLKPFIDQNRSLLESIRMSLNSQQSSILQEQTKHFTTIYKSLLTEIKKPIFLKIIEPSPELYLRYNGLMLGGAEEWERKQFNQLQIKNLIHLLLNENRSFYDFSVECQGWFNHIGFILNEDEVKAIVKENLDKRIVSTEIRDQVDKFVLSIFINKQPFYLDQAEGIRRQYIAYEQFRREVRSFLDKTIERFEAKITETNFEGIRKLDTYEQKLLEEAIGKNMQVNSVEPQKVNVIQPPQTLHQLRTQIFSTNDVNIDAIKKNFNSIIDTKIKTPLKTQHKGLFAPLSNWLSSIKRDFSAFLTQCKLKLDKKISLNSDMMKDDKLAAVYTKAEIYSGRFFTQCKSQDKTAHATSSESHQPFVLGIVH